MEPPTESPRAPERSPTERKILEAAELAFLETSRELVKITDVAQAAGVSVGLVYMYFGSKAGLFAAVREDIQLEVLEFTMDPIVRPGPSGWHHVIENNLKWERFFSGDVKRVRIIATLDYNTGEDEYVATVNQRMAARVGVAIFTASERIRELVEQGELRPCEPVATALWIYSTVIGSGIILLQTPPDTLTPAIIADHFARQRMMLAQALLPPDRLSPDGTAPPEYWATGPAPGR